LFFKSEFRTASILFFVIGQLTLAEVADALVPKQDDGLLESLTFVSESLQISAQSEAVDDVRVTAADGIANTWDSFRVSHGDWSAIIDKRTGKIESAEGEGIPFVPGNGNQIQMKDISADLGDDRQIDLARMEAITRAFLPRVTNLLGVDPSTLILNQGRSGHPADYLWYVDFDVTFDGMAVEGARVVFRVNNGNLIQFGSENLPAEGTKAPKAKVTRNQALKSLSAYIGSFSAADVFLDGGSQRLLPVDLAHSRFAEGFERGKGRGLVRIWQFVFRREGDHGTWRARIDATNGKMLEFLDINDYAQVAGGVKSLSGTETRPMPFADISSGGYTNSAGVYNYTSGTTVTSALDGQYVSIDDHCGQISMPSDILGNLAFGTSTGTSDCNTPGFGGAGNTRASRTQFYTINRAKEMARGWLNLPWLTAQLTTKVNLTDYNGDGICNAFWNGATLNLYQKSTSCSNSGEIQGVGLHEFGHALDANDGTDPIALNIDKGTGETYGDWTAALFTHESCIGAGLLTSNCDGYGDACTSCTGVRDIDYSKHSSNIPHTVSNFTQSLCPAGNGYIGPCGRKGHCESYVSSEALWDLAVRDLPSPGTASAWAIMDRLWYLSRSTATAAFTCFKTTPWSSDGCGSGSLWKTMRAVDDDDGNLSNGTPHSAALYAAFNRHAIACPSDAGANTSFRGCFQQPTTPTLSLAAANNQVALSWSGSTGVYDVYRNEQGCGASFIKVANDLTNPLFVDTGVANDFTYYYQVIAQPSGSEGCASAPSSCSEALPCQPPAAPANLVGTAVSVDQIDLSWPSSLGATRYHIYRATTPNGPYTKVGAQSGNTFSDTGLSSCTSYYYVVRAAGNETCESGNSIQVTASTAATTTSSCVLNVFVSGPGWAESSPWEFSCFENYPCSMAYPYNTPVTLLAFEDYGFSKFLGWSGACTGTDTCTVTMTQAHSVTATFAEIVPLWVYPDGEGLVTSTPVGIQCGGWETECEAYYLAGTAVTLTAIPKAGHIFTGWQDSSSTPQCLGTGTCTVTLTNSEYSYIFGASFEYGITLTASVNGAGTGTIMSSPAGINCGTDCSELYPHQMQVSLTATPASGSTFSGWSGACTGTGTCTVSMSEARSVTATFSAGLTYALTEFYTLPVPCRVFDSRITGPQLTSQVPRIINIAGNCGVPATASAVSLNVTALAAPGDGFITLYPGDITLPGTWTIGFPASLNRANNAVIPLAWNGNGTLAAVAVITGGGSMDMALDVNGYFE
jgi:trimeric autotransporter adhesin